MKSATKKPAAKKTKSRGVDADALIRAAQLMARYHEMAKKG